MGITLFWEDPADELDILARATAERIRHQQTEAERKQLASMITRALGHACHINPLYIGQFSDEELVDFDTDEWKPGRLVVPCRACQRPLSPLCAESRVIVDAGWRWVGLDHQQPERDYFFACGWCGTPMFFTLVTPQ